MYAHAAKAFVGDANRGRALGFEAQVVRVGGVEGILVADG